MNYNFLFIWLIMVAVFSNSGRNDYRITANGYEQRYTSKAFAIITFLPIIVFACMSSWEYWVDYPNYLNYYINLPQRPSEAFAVIKQQDDSWLFYTFTYFVKFLSGGNLFAYRLALAIVQSVPLVYLYRKYSPNYVYSIFLVVVTAVPLAWMLNCVRQLVAAGIIYAATPLIIKKKYVKVTLIILFASLFHQTAIIMLPCVFIAQGAAWNKRTNLAIVGAVIITAVFAGVSGTREAFIEAAGYSTARLIGDDGTHPLRVLMNFVPVFLAWLGRRSIEEDSNPTINYFINMAIIAFGIYLIAMVTSGILVARVPLYMSLYNYILLPYLIRKLFGKDLRGVVFFAATVGYLLYYYLLYGRRY